MEAFLPKIKKQATAGTYLSNIWNMFHDFVCACLDCKQRVGARVRLRSEFILQVYSSPDGLAIIFAATLERAKLRQDCAAQKMTAAVLT